MSKIEVDNVVPQSGTNINLGESGDTVTVPAGVTLDTSNSTVTLPDGSVTNAKLAGSIANDKLTNSSITINGSSVSLGGSTTIETGISWESTIVTGTTLSAVVNKGYWINTTSNACTVTLPASASVGDQLIFTDYARTWNTNNLTLNRNSLKYQGGTENPVYDTAGQTVNIVYSGTTNGWIPISDDIVADEGTIPSVTVDFLVIGGGAGAGTNTSVHDVGTGGGGAGGYRASYNNETSGGNSSAESPLSFIIGETYTITVGGGSGGASSSAPCSNGSNSSIVGSGVSLTSLGGGGGGSGTTANSTAGEGQDGGSGGGSALNFGATYDTPLGTSGQGSNGGLEDSYGGGGGGGAGAAGQDAVSMTGGNGGNGLASTITGSSVTRAGGGGGGAYGTSVASGGSGGGGSAGRPGSAGTANTGSGGGGYNGSGGNNGTGGSGGSGVVIIRLPTADYTGTTTGSPSVSTSGSDTILVFNASGSYTA